MEEIINKLSERVKMVTQLTKLYFASSNNLLDAAAEGKP